METPGGSGWMVGLGGVEVMVALGALVLLVALAVVAVVVALRRRRRRDAPLGHMPSGWLEHRASADPAVDADQR